MKVSTSHCYMQSPRHAGRVFVAAALLSLCGFAGAQVQSGLPPTAPTSMPAPIAATALTGPVASRPKKATVTYAAGLLDVRANDSSLNSILRLIAQKTGMTISGSVADQRVFGNYGPAEPSVVLATLLDGTGTNVLIRESQMNAPAELVLTPRQGGPTPPSPDVQANEPEEEDTSVAPAPIPAPSFPARSTGVVGPAGSIVPPTALQQVPPTALQQALPPLATQQAPPTATQLSPALPISGHAPGVSNTGTSNTVNNGVLGSPNAVSPSASTLPVTNSVAVDAVGAPTTPAPVPGIVDSPTGPPAGTTTAGFNAAATVGAASPTTPTDDADTSGSTLPGGSTSSAGSGSAPSGITTPEQIYQKLQQLQHATQAAQASPGQPGTATGSSTATTPATTTPQPAPSPQ